MEISDLHDECKHGMPKTLCSLCKERATWGMLKTRPYREAIVDLFPMVDPLPVKARRCEECPRRGACKGNRLNVRLPRDRVSFSIGAPVHPPSWLGPMVTRPKVRNATHRHKGKWLCDKCDPDHAVGMDDIAPAVLSEADIFV